VAVLPPRDLLAGTGRRLQLEIARPVAICLRLALLGVDALR
jgi:hypothetical protein